MIRTLRITSVIAAIAALVLLVLPIVYGVREDPRVEQLLNSPTAVESFKKTAGRKKTKTTDQLSPLVRQADAFAKYLAPKPKPKKPTPGKRTPAKAAPRPLGNVSAKFELVATSFYKSHPELSLALIDEPGKDLHWVRQGQKVGRLVIEQVADGSVTVRDGQRTSEIKVKRDNPRKSLVKGESSAPNEKLPARPGLGIRRSPAMPKTPISARQKPKPRVRNRISRRTLPKQAVPSSAKVSEQERTRLDELIARLQAIPDGDANNPAAAEKRAEIIEKLISGIGSTDLNPEEQKLLDHLGEGLNPADDVPPRPGDVDSADNADKPQPPPPPPDNR